MTDKLAVYAAVVESGNLTRAGERLFLSQSAVSRIVEALEREYGVRLLDRTNKSVRPTAAGHIVYQHALKAKDLAADTQQRIQELRAEPVGILAIGAGFTYGEYLLPHVMAKFVREYPLVHPKVTIMNCRRIAQRVKDGILALGIIEGDDLPEGVFRQPFAEDELVLVVPPTHPLHDHSTVNLADLADERWILREAGSATRQIVDRVFQDHAFTPSRRMEFGSSQIIKESVIAGLGISLLSRWSISAEVQQGLLIPLRLTGYPVVSNFCAIVNASGFRPKVVTTFQQFLTAYTADDGHFAHRIPPG